MTVLATLYNPSLNLIGPHSLTALAVCIVAWVLVELTIWRKEITRDLVAALVPIVLFCCTLVSGTPVVIQLIKLAFLLILEAFPLILKILPFLRIERFPSAEHFIADYLYLAVGFVLAMKAARCRTRDVHRTGLTVTILLGAVILIEAGFRLAHVAGY